MLSRSALAITRGSRLRDRDVRTWSARPVLTQSIERDRVGEVIVTGTWQGSDRPEIGRRPGREKDLSGLPACCLAKRSGVGRDQRHFGAYRGRRRPETIDAPCVGLRASGREG